MSKQPDNTRNNVIPLKKPELQFGEHEIQIVTTGNEVIEPLKGLTWPKIKSPKSVQ